MEQVGSAHVVVGSPVQVGIVCTLTGGKEPAGEGVVHILLHTEDGLAGSVDGKALVTARSNGSSHGGGIAESASQQIIPACCVVALEEDAHHVAGGAVTQQQRLIHHRGQNQIAIDGDVFQEAVGCAVLILPAGQLPVVGLVIRAVVELFLTQGGDGLALLYFQGLHGGTSRILEFYGVLLHILLPDGIDGLGGGALGQPQGVVSLIAALGCSGGVRPAQEGVAVPGGNGAGDGEVRVIRRGGLGIGPVGLFAAVGIVGQNVICFLFTIDMDGKSNNVVVPVIIAWNRNTITAIRAVARVCCCIKVIVEFQSNSCCAGLCGSVVELQARPRFIAGEVAGICQGKFAILQDTGIRQRVTHSGTNPIIIRDIFG